MTHDDQVSLAMIGGLIALQAVATYVLLLAFVRLMRWVDERADKRRARATVKAWWLAEVEQVADQYDDAGDGSDEGLLRQAPADLLRRTLDADARETA